MIRVLTFAFLAALWTTLVSANPICPSVLQGHLEGLDYSAAAVARRLETGLNPPGERPLQALPYMASARPDLAWLPPLIRNKTQVSIRELKELVDWAPVWTQSSRAEEVRAALIERIGEIEPTEISSDVRLFSDEVRDAVVILRWLMDQPDPIGGARAVEFAKSWVTTILKRGEAIYFADSSRWMASLISLLPYGQFSAEARAKFEKNWLNFSINPPIAISGGIKTTIETVNANVCQEMFRTHICALMPKVFEEINIMKHAGSFVLVSLNGRLLGSLKTRRAGEPSLLSFRNVYGPDGRLAFVAGGIYRISVKTMDEIVKVTGPLYDAEKNLRVDLKEVAARPISFLLNENTDLRDGIMESLLLEIAPRFALEGHATGSDGYMKAVWARLQNVLQQIADGKLTVKPD